MRDSGLKRFLLSGYFSALEVWSALRGMTGHPRWTLDFDYDAYWRRRTPGALQPRFKIIAEHVQAGSTLLDVGCGDGVMLTYLEEEKNVRGVGIDISTVAVEQARRRGVDARVSTLGALCRQAPIPHFDHVVMSEVLEHVPDPETMVRQGWELAQSSLWLTFPNIAYLPHRLRLAAGKFPVQWAVFPGEHLRFWSVTDFRHWLQQLDVVEPRMWPSNGLTLLGLHRMWPNLAANQIVVRLKKSQMV